MKSESDAAIQPWVAPYEFVKNTIASGGSLGFLALAEVVWVYAADLTRVSVLKSRSLGIEILPGIQRTSASTHVFCKLIPCLYRVPCIVAPCLCSRC